ncbi:hypothetical protein, partial [Candidatus Pseudoscillospira sp. SGI.172]|uniref:hypothetical protein n=1 Tax=Candidatus Pseudoscillospira sp. SGI.172 TaxID=3420582 RepID=UPI003D01E270
AGAKEVGSVSCRGVYVAENTSQPVSVRMVRLRRTMRARDGLHPARKSGAATFSTVSDGSAAYAAPPSFLKEPLNQSPHVSQRQIFRLARQKIAGILCVFQDFLTQSGGKSAHRSTYLV